MIISRFKFEEESQSSNFTFILGSLVGERSLTQKYQYTKIKKTANIKGGGVKINFLYCFIDLIYRGRDYKQYLRSGANPLKLFTPLAHVKQSP